MEPDHAYFYVQYYLVISVLIWLLMLISYSLFIHDKVVTMQDEIRENLKQAARSIA